MHFLPIVFHEILTQLYCPHLMNEEMELSYFRYLRPQDWQGRSRVRLPDCWDHTHTRCTKVHYAVKEHGQYRLEKEKGAGGEKTRETGQIKEGYLGATPHFQQSVADEKYFRKVSRVTDEGEKERRQ